MNTFLKKRSTYWLVVCFLAIVISVLDVSFVDTMIIFLGGFAMGWLCAYGD